MLKSLFFLVSFNQLLVAYPIFTPRYQIVDHRSQVCHHYITMFAESAMFKKILLVRYPMIFTLDPISSHKIPWDSHHAWLIITLHDTTNLLVNPPMFCGKKSLQTHLNIIYLYILLFSITSYDIPIRFIRSHDIHLFGTIHQEQDIPIYPNIFSSWYHHIFGWLTPQCWSNPFRCQLAA